MTFGEHISAPNPGRLMNVSAKRFEYRLQQLSVLVVDDNAFTRKIVRSLLGTVGVKTIHEAGDGIAALELIRTVSPDVIVLDWEMPLLNGPELVRIVRSPGVFPTPDIPIIMLSAHGERWRIVESARLGVNEFLCKPVSAKSLLERLVSILMKPRESVKLGAYYGPAPRLPEGKPAPVREADPLAI
jgi:two-component system, chemotaxis family, chemotaxis protein CheY